MGSILTEGSSDLFAGAFFWGVTAHVIVGAVIGIIFSRPMIAYIISLIFGFGMFAIFAGAATALIGPFAMSGSEGQPSLGEAGDAFVPVFRNFFVYAVIFQVLPSLFGTWLAHRIVHKRRR